METTVFSKLAPPVRKICEGGRTDLSPASQAVWCEWCQNYAATGVWDTSMKSRGIGDTVAKFTKVTGIAAAVNWVSTATGIPCGCGGRQEALNQAVSYQG